jgi:hypothetical protein
MFENKPFASRLQNGPFGTQPVLTEMAVNPAFRGIQSVADAF